MTPEDKAQNMPSEIWLYYDNHPDELRVKWADFDAGSSMYPATKYTRTIQSPDQGAVDKLDLLQKRAYSHADKSNSPKLMREWIDSDVEVIRQALTRPPLDLAQTKAEIDPWVSTTIPERTFFPKTDVARWIELYLDRLQAIRPDLFGGK